MPLRKVFAWLLLLGPFLPYAIAVWLVQHGLSHNALVEWYLAANPLWSAAVVTFVYANVLFVVGLIIHNHSIFDFNWSMLPGSFFALHYGMHPLQKAAPLRFWLLFIGVSLWGLRLSGNWLYKGGLAFEDFRYVNYRKAMSPVVFFIFAYVALFLIQGAMVYGMTTPFYVALRAPAPVAWLDYLAFAIVIGGTTIELVADTQQHRFRRTRDEKQRAFPELFTGTPPKEPRFLTTGLWKYSRHPNYFGEASVWWGFYLFGVAATGQWVHWSLVGPLTVTGLFLGGSIRITEENELKRKPEYAEYQKRVSRLIPWFPKA